MKHIIFLSKQQIETAIFMYLTQSDDSPFSGYRMKPEDYYGSIGIRQIENAMYFLEISFNTADKASQRMTKLSEELLKIQAEINAKKEELKQLNESESTEEDVWSGNESC